MSMRRASFASDFAFSRGRSEERDKAALRSFFGNSCTAVKKTTEAQDRAGDDYIVTLRRGATVLVDAKARRAGAARWWRYGEPDLQLETYSVMPMPGLPKGKVGWTLNEATNTDFILFTYDERDTTAIYLISFQLLRLAFRANYRTWRAQYDLKPQDSGAWKSECMFVPRSIVAAAIDEIQWRREIPLVRGGQLSIPAFAEL